MNQTNWSRALTHQATIESFVNDYSQERFDQLIKALLAAGGTFAVSQGRLNLSDFSLGIANHLFTEWRKEDKAAKIAE